MANNNDPSLTGQPGTPAGNSIFIPGLQLLRCFARGSYGEIWLAKSELGAFRAVKIIRRATFTTSKPYDREFAGLQRYEPISREHEGLVDVLQVGQDLTAGFFYYVMELADAVRPQGEDCKQPPSDSRHLLSSILDPDSYVAQTLAHAIHTRTRLPGSEVIELGLCLARALEFLHSRQLVHRDIKPSNIIFVGGHPKLADVGLVADLGNPQSLVGTEGYIPPEGPGTAQADIYSLGKVLYEAATGKDRQEFPDLPTRLGEGSDDPALPELNEVLLKACESNSRSRYRTAAAMAADLERLKAGQSLRARRIRLTRARRVTVAVAMVAGLVAIGYATTNWVKNELSKPKLLFRDDFDALHLDANRWKASNDSFFATPGRGQTSSEIAQVGGELVLNTKADHDKDTVSEVAWVDSRYDFRQGADCTMEITISGTTIGGFLAVTLAADGTHPDASGSGGEDCVLFNTETGASNGWPKTTLKVDILQMAKAAIVYPIKDRPEDFQVLALAKLPSWHVRFVSGTVASMGYRAGDSTLHVERVSVWTKPTDQRIVGRVVDEISGNPIVAATIRDGAGQPIGRTSANGAFAVQPLKDGRIKVEKAGYESRGKELLADGSSRSVVEIPLKKEKAAFGDVVETFGIPDLNVQDIGFRDNSLILLVHDSDRKCSLRPAFPSQDGKRYLNQIIREFEPGENNNFTLFADCGGRFIGIKHWHGDVLDLDTNRPQLLFKLTHPGDGSPIDWPKACAYDGELLWFIESDPEADQFALHALDLAQQEIRHTLRGSDRHMQGLAWDGAQFWISNSDGCVYAVNREDAVRYKAVHLGRGREFPGYYDKIAFAGGHLWGKQDARRRICKIKITD